MVGKVSPPELISPEEANSLYLYMTMEEMDRAKSLFHVFSDKLDGKNPQWDLWYLLAFVYCTGRVQGIREERKRNKNR